MIKMHKWLMLTHTHSFTIVLPCIVTDSLWIKPTNALNSNFIGITTLHVLGSLSAYHQEFLPVHRLWYILCSCDDRLLLGVGWSSILLLVANGHHKCIKCTTADVRLRTPDDGQKGCPKHVEFHPTPGSKQSSQLHKMYHSRCTAKNSWWWAERLPKTCRVPSYSW